jgi:hypothetical protein
MKFPDGQANTSVVGNEMTDRDVWYEALWRPTLPQHLSADALAAKELSNDEVMEVP